MMFILRKASIWRRSVLLDTSPPRSFSRDFSPARVDSLRASEERRALTFSGSRFTPSTFETSDSQTPSTYAEEIHMASSVDLPTACGQPPRHTKSAMAEMPSIDPRATPIGFSANSVPRETDPDEMPSSRRVIVSIRSRDTRPTPLCIGWLAAFGNHGLCRERHTDR